jgi:glycosyltransferase involved in cell wall biosynthesis
MRVLLITPEAPAPVHVNGGATRQYELFRRLIELGHSVTAVAVMPPHVADFSQQLRAEGFDLRPVRRQRSVLRDVLFAVLRKPSTLTGLFTDSIDDFAARVFWVPLEPVLREALADGPYDVVCLEHQYCAGWIGRFEPPAPAILEIHEVRSIQFRASAALHGGLRGLFWRINARRVLRAERRWTPRFAAAVTMSETEARRIREIVPGMPPVHVVGNGARLDAFAEAGPDPDRRRVLFTGTLNFAPNAGAAQWLAREVWPRVLERVPDAELEIVGRDPSRATLALDQLPGVAVHANVPDIVPWYERASVCTLPMLEGGGTRLKFAEAMAAGRAVVSTANGAEGVLVEDGREALIADSPADFAAAIVRLLEDPALRRELGERGRSTAAAEYDWRRLGDKLAAAFEETASGR